MGLHYGRGASPVAFRFFRRHQARNDLVVEGRRQPWTERAHGGDVSVSRSFPRSFHTTGISAGYAVTHVQSVDPFAGELDPNFPVPFIPQRGVFTRARVGFTYSDARAQIYDMTTSVGRTTASQPSSRCMRAMRTWFSTRTSTSSIWNGLPM